MSSRSSAGLRCVLLACAATLCSSAAPLQGSLRNAAADGEVARLRELLDWADTVCGSTPGNSLLVDQCVQADCPVRCGAGARAAFVNDPAETDEHSLASPLALAVAWGRQDAVEFLLKEGGDLLAHDKAGVAPLHIAAISAEPAMVALLLQAADRTNVARALAAKTMGGYNPLLLAVREGRAEVVAQLLRLTNVEAPTDEGKTPLLLCIENARKLAEPVVLSVVRALLRGGASTAVPDEPAGRNLLAEAAQQAKMSEVARVLRTVRQLKEET